MLASYKIGRGGGWTRARQRLARGTLRGPRNAPAASGRGSSSAAGPLERERGYRNRLRIALVTLWIALLLSIVGYGVVKGEGGLAEIEAMGFKVLPALD